MKNIFTVIALCAIALSTATAAEFSADMISVMSGNKYTGKIYFKDSDTSRNEEMNLIRIVKRPQVYMVFTDTKKYYVTNLDEMKKKNPMAGIKNFKEFIKNNDLKKVGTETVQGLSCDIYEGKMAFSENQSSAPIKIWYSDKLEYSVKTEITLAPMGKMSSYLENIKQGTQPESLFEIPSGYSEAKSMQEAMGMDNIPFPKGMKEMMKQRQQK